MFFSILILSLLVPTLSLPATYSQDVAPRAAGIPTLQQMCTDKIKKTMLYDPKPEAAAILFQKLKNNITGQTIPLMLGVLNEALINRIGWQKPCELSSHEEIVLVHAYNADNLYDDAGNRITWKNIRPERTTLQVVNQQTGTPLHTFEDFSPHRTINAFAYNTDRTLAALATEGRIYIKDVADDTVVKIIDLYRDAIIQQIEFGNNDDTIVYSDAFYDYLAFVSIATERLIANRINDIQAFRLSPDRKLRACISEDVGVLKIFNNETNACIKTEFNCTAFRLSHRLLEWSPDGTYVIWACNRRYKEYTGTRSGFSIKVWNRYSNEICYEATLLPLSINVAAFTREGSLFLEAPDVEPRCRLICKNYMEMLSTLAACDETGASEKQLIPFLLTAWEKSWRINKPHVVGGEERDCYYTLCTLFPFMMNNALFKLDFFSSLNK